LSNGDRNIRAAFWLDASGRAVHVCPFVGDNVVLNSEEGGAKVKALESVNRWFEKRHCKMYQRSLDRAALEKMAAEGAVSGLDGGFWEYFEG
jgi:murein DD-endopeptidase